MVLVLVTWIGPFQFHVSFIIIGQVVGPIEIHLQHLNPILQRTMHCLQQNTFALLSNASANRWHRLEIVANDFRVSYSLASES